MIGGGGEKKTLRVVAQYADIWNYVGGPIDNFLHKCEVLAEHCAAVGRDPSTIERSVQLFTDVQNPENTRDLARSFIEAGATHLILGLRPPYPEGVVHKLAEKVVEPLLEEFASK